MPKSDKLGTAIQALPDPPETLTVLPASHLTKAKYFKDIALDGMLYSAEQNQATYAKLNHTTNIPKSRSF